jgi:hypothetical protein
LRVARISVQWWMCHVLVLKLPIQSPTGLCWTVEHIDYLEY